MEAAGLGIGPVDALAEIGQRAERGAGRVKNRRVLERGREGIDRGAPVVVLRHLFTIFDSSFECSHQVATTRKRRIDLLFSHNINSSLPASPRHVHCCFRSGTSALPALQIK